MMVVTIDSMEENRSQSEASVVGRPVGNDSSGEKDGLGLDKPTERLPGNHWIYTTNERQTIAHGTTKGLRRRYRGLPGEVSTIGMGNFDFSQMATRPLATVDRPFREMTDNAVDMVVQRQSHGSHKNPFVGLRSMFVVREFTGPAKGEAS
ncbi:MAG: substrate-binding domain-containing protein [Syntrophales bacterium]